MNLWRLVVILVLFSIPFALSGCGGGKKAAKAPVTAAQEVERTAPSRSLEPAGAAGQRHDPVAALNVYLDGFHFHNGNVGSQVEAHHFCSELNEDVTQCVIYDGNGRDARLMGIEYVVFDRVFKTLPEDERKLWHSHAYEVRSGQLIAPGMSDQAELDLMRKLASTYGKTWHTWHTDQGQRLPTGIPSLMMGFTGEGQANPGLVKDRDKRMGVSTEKEAKKRADIQPPPIQPGADAWKQGDVLQLEIGRETGSGHKETTMFPTKKSTNRPE